MSKREALLVAAAHVVMEYESHGGERTHKDCLGHACLLKERVKALRAAVEKIAPESVRWPA